MPRGNLDQRSRALVSTEKRNLAQLHFNKHKVPDRFTPVFFGLVGNMVGNEDLITEKVSQMKANPLISFGVPNRI
jgi:hypothetical protein